MRADTGRSVMEARQVVKAYRSGDRAIEVLRGVDLRVGAGESVSIRGESGCGKSTLLNVLAGIETADAGEVAWEGASLGAPGSGSLNTRRAHFMGFVFQAYYLIPELNALENVVLAGRIAGQPLGATRERALALLERLGLGDRLLSHPGQLSGGERQRAAIARALINGPRVILADEPTGNLDERTAARVMDELFAIVQDYGASLVLVTHNPAFAELTERSLVLHDGRLVGL